jgi:hypothetical protein
MFSVVCYQDITNITDFVMLQNKPSSAAAVLLHKTETMHFLNTDVLGTLDK